VSQLVVWIADRRVGAMIRKPNGNLQFRYDATYDGPPISQSLPLQGAAHAHRATRAVFGGLLPEGDVRAVLARNLGVSEGNDYGLLGEVGGDVAGAISLLPDGMAPETLPTSAKLDDEQLARLLDDLPQRPLGADAGEGIRLSLAGAQPKVPVIIDDSGVMALPTNSAAPTTHILKPEPARFTGLVDNEAFCMMLARACELPVARVAKPKTISGLPYDRGAPTLAPLYDIVSTMIYPELTTRLAMSIGGARELADVDDASWVKLAADAGYRPAFVTQTVSSLLRRAANEARPLIATAEHDNDAAREITARIQRLATGKPSDA
jgi:HipA-like protein